VVVFGALAVFVAFMIAKVGGTLIQVRFKDDTDSDTTKITTTTSCELGYCDRNLVFDC